MNGIRDFWEHRNDPDVAVLIMACVFGGGMAAFGLAAALGWVQ